MRQWFIPPPPFKVRNLHYDSQSRNKSTKKLKVVTSGKNLTQLLPLDGTRCQKMFKFFYCYGRHFLQNRKSTVTLHFAVWPKCYLQERPFCFKTRLKQEQSAKNETKTRRQSDAAEIFSGFFPRLRCSLRPISWKAELFPHLETCSSILSDHVGHP